MRTGRTHTVDFGKYRLIERLARGGMAEIYRAKYVGAAGITKSVVLKKILPTFAGNKRFVQMFIDEAKITVGLSHGNIAQVFDFGEIAGEYFLAMEFVHGQSLARVQHRADELGLVIPIPIACFLVMEMCKGLHYAHRKADDRGTPLGIVHRDVSPQNVMVSYEGQVKLVDFGIAKAATVAANTEAGALKGKYLYFAPEQARGEPLDGRADLFATGIVLYELLTGQRPFQGQLMEVLRGIVDGRFTRPSRINRELPPSLESMVLKALATHRDDRWATGLEFQEALASFLYTAAPRFTSANLAHFMQYLYHEELIAEGLSLDLPAEFLEQVPLWRKPAAQPGQGGGSEDESGGTGVDSQVASGPGATSAERPRALEKEAAGRSRSARLALLVAIPIAVMGIVAGAVISASRAIAPNVGAGMAAVQTTPQGAAIFMDGEDTGARTPHVFEELSPGRTYGLTLRLEGHQAVLTTFTPSATGPVSVEHTLLALATDTPGPQDALTEAELRKRLREATREESIVRPTGFSTSLEQLAAEMGRVEGRGAPNVDAVFDLRRDTLNIRRLPAVRVVLDRQRSHRVSVSGAIFVGDPLMTPGAPGCFYLIDRGQSEQVGIVTSEHPLEIEAGARAVYFVVADVDPSDNSGRLLLRVTDDLEQPRDLVIDGRKNAFSPKAKGIRELDELMDFQDYGVTLKSRATAWPPLLYIRRPGVSAITTFGAGIPIGQLEDGARFRGAKDVFLFSLTASKQRRRGQVGVHFSRR